ncbi:SMC protein-like protein [Moraxella macacae 0408225]|uniref:Chromosome partition protein Smc n=1 Tax=Moraxella macacae 0408225 TaxID=1230338 RepID=L2F8K9_9GAMM|nr:AAA family ATPase [Moraxella macacae]ELA08808.1 SMC protein-like protein [Moraxella macacae 0408225]
MRLKQLKLAGFKSFANPTTFHFKHNITAIVGPNGCGKSNVIDAIRWVLGESSAKQLRGGAMSDVIFAGTQQKSAKSLASVELIFENTQGDALHQTYAKSGIQHSLNLYHELSVRRQMSREGKSDYFINGTKVRRRDVVDVFLGTGLGARSYAVIEQGMIGRIIEANALQLREFIEEASGVSRYQHRREETQKQLDHANDNLNRLNDMTGELTAQQKRLEKQATIAKQAHLYQQQIDEINTQLLINEAVQVSKQHQNLHNQQQDLKQKIAEAQNAVNQLTEQDKQLQQKIYEQQLAKQEQQNLCQNYWQKHHEAQSLYQQQQNLLNQQQAKIDELTKTEQNLTAQLNQISSEQHANAKHLQTLPNKLMALQTTIEQKQQVWQQTERQRQIITGEISQLQQQKQEYEKQLAIVENLLKTAQQQAQKLTLHQQQHQKNQAIFEQKQQDHVAKHAKFDDNQITVLTEKIHQLENIILDRQQQITDQADTLESLDRQHHKALQQQEQWQTEQKTLQKLVDDYDQFLQKIAQNQHKINQKTPTNLDLHLLLTKINLSSRGKLFSKQLDKCLAILTQWLVLTPVLSEKQNLFDFSVLFGKKAVLFDAFFTNQLTQLQHKTSLKTETVPKTDPPKTEQRLENQHWICLSALLITPDLPIFSHVWLLKQPLCQQDFIDNHDVLLSLIHQLPHFLPSDWLLIFGEHDEILLLNSHLCLDLHALVWGLGSGEKNHAKPTPIPAMSQYFSQQQRIEALQDLIDKQRPICERLANQVQVEAIALQEWQAQDQASRNELLQLNQQKQQLSHDRLQYQHEISQLQTHERHLAQELDRLTGEQTQISQTIQNHQADAERIRQQLAEIQPRLNQKIQVQETLDQELADQHAKQKSYENQYHELSLALNKAELQQQHQLQIQQKLHHQQQHEQQQLQTLIQSFTQLQQELPTFVEQVDKCQQRLAQSTSVLEEIDAKLVELEQQKINEQHKFQAKQQQLQNLQQQGYDKQTELALINQRSEQISQQMLNQGVAMPTQEQALQNQVLLSVNDVDVKRRALRQLQQNLQQLGAVNHAALAELDTITQRLSPLSEQINDLTASIDKLREAIRQIDSQTKQLFMNMLNQVNVDLNQLFVQVFGGGQASLVLVDDSWQSGLELMAKPKGKKNSRLALLSGGEKTLTALSLVFAIFKQQPAPFCVLDEVDAPLDDANVARFTSLIGELAKDVQFIFISHNKLAMQAADELKGVTMPTAGVSRLVSVDMNEVAAYLESDKAVQ